MIPSPVSGVVPPVEFRWKKGQSGNPKGGRLTAEANARLSDDRIVREVVDALLERIRAGDVRAIELLWDRHEGKLIQKNENDDVVRTIVMESGVDFAVPEEETP